MTNDERLEAYKACQIRKHQREDELLSWCKLIVKHKGKI
jgi:hypothetical protein